MKKCFAATFVAAALAAWGLVPQAQVHAQTGFDAAAVKGTYGFTEQGTFGNTTPLVGFGILNLDGAGNVSGTETLQVYGAGMQSLQFQGAYTVNSNGTGSMLLTVEAPAPAADPNAENPPEPATYQARYDFVVVNNKLELRGIRADNGLTVTANFARQ